MASNILYPPVIDATMPAFTFDDNHPSMRVYFSISDYNSLEKIKHIAAGETVNDPAISDEYLAEQEEQEGVVIPYRYLPNALSADNIKNKTYEQIIHELFTEHGGSDDINHDFAGHDGYWLRVAMPDGPYREGVCPNNAFNLPNGQYDYWSYLIAQGDKGLQILTDSIKEKVKDIAINYAHLPYNDNWMVRPEMLNWTPDTIINSATGEEEEHWFCYYSIDDIQHYIDTFRNTTKDIDNDSSIEKSRIFAFNNSPEVIDGNIYPWVIVSCKNDSGDTKWKSTISNQYSTITSESATFKYFSMYRDNIKYLNGDSNCYYILITKKDIETKIDEVYNFQIRFIEDIDDWPQLSDNWINNNLNSLSEWSSVSSATYINKPTITIKDSDIGYNDDGMSVNFIGKIVNSHFIHLNIDTSLEAKNEYLSAYRIRLYSNSEKFFEYPLEDSGWQKIKSNITLNSYEIDYRFKKLYEKNVIYYLYIDIQTSSGYTTCMYTYVDEDGELGYDAETAKIDVKISNYNVFTADIQLDSVPNHESGEVLIRVWDKYSSFDGNLIILRTSSATNFEDWDTLLTFENITDANCLYWVDRTVSCDEWYLYAVIYGNMFTYSYKDIEGNTKTNKRYVETDAIMAAEPVNMFLDDSFLVGDHKSLKIKFDPNISSFKWKVTESSIETLGSKYPFFNKNAVINYRTFPISGTIATWMDDEQNFVNREELFNPKAFNYHMDFTRDNRIEAHYDWVMEKKFRDALVAFLMDAKPKLFKSLTEGNVLVRIHDVSFTPNKTLGRMIWSFNATATEIGEASLENINKYGIQENTIVLNFNDIGDLVYNPPYNKDEDLMVLPNGFYIMQEKEIKDFTIRLIGKTNTEKYCIRLSRPANGGDAGGEADKLDEFGAPLPSREETP